MNSHYFGVYGRLINGLRTLLLRDAGISTLAVPNSGRANACVPAESLFTIFLGLAP